MNVVSGKKHYYRRQMCRRNTTICLDFPPDQVSHTPSVDRRHKTYTMIHSFLNSDVSVPLAESWIFSVQLKLLFTFLYSRPVRKKTANDWHGIWGTCLTASWIFTAFFLSYMFPTPFSCLWFIQRCPLLLLLFRFACQQQHCCFQSLRRLLGSAVPPLVLSGSFCWLVCEWRRRAAACFFSFFFWSPTPFSFLAGLALPCEGLACQV